MDKKDLLAIIDSRLKELKLSSSAASKMAVGNDALISNIRRERHGLPSLENLQKLSDVLGLELYFRYPREPQNAAKTRSDHEAIALLDDFAFVERFDVSLSAGPGSANDNARHLAPVAFRKDWLMQNGLRAEKCVVCGVRGDSMIPLLYDGDLALLDRTRADLRDGQVYGLVDIEGDVRIKRVDQVENGLLLRSENSQYSPELRLGADANRVRIIGRLALSSHTHAQNNFSLPTKAKGKRTKSPHGWF